MNWPPRARRGCWSAGVKLELLGGEQGVPTVRGNRDRLRQMMEHLLNNSAQAIAGGPAGCVPR